MVLLMASLTDARLRRTIRAKMDYRRALLANVVTCLQPDGPVCTPCVFHTSLHGSNVSVEKGGRRVSWKARPHAPKLSVSASFRSHRPRT